MIGPYLDAVLDALGGVRDVLLRLALPLALGGAVVVAAFMVAAARRSGGGETPLPRWDGRRVRVATGYALVGLLAVVAWAGLRAAQPLARQAVQWEESAEATANPAPDAPPVYQFGPAVSALVERTYTRTLTLPPDFLQRIGSEGVEMLAPYLSDPSAEEVLRLVDTFRRSGRDVVFTRAVTRRDEDPIPFTGSQVRAVFKRLPGRAYDVAFEGRYTFANAGAAPITARFTFPLPQAGTVRDLAVAVDGQAVTEPDEKSAYEWIGPVPPGQSREAVVRYQVVGARTWHYDIGSRRRRVQKFRLEVVPNGSMRFLRGSLQPTAVARISGKSLRWELENVVTAQQVAVAFPPDVLARDVYLQSLGALPAALAVFLALVLAVGLRAGGLPGLPEPGALAFALVVFALGLGSASVLANYVGPVAGLLVGPLFGALLAARALGWRRWLPASLCSALLPEAFLSPTHSGLLVLVLAFLALAALAAPPSVASRTDATNA